MSLDSKAFRNTMSQWTTGVTIITTSFEGELHGMTASSFSSLSINPLLVSISVNKSANTHDLIKNSSIFAVNILDVNQIELGKRFAGMYPEITDRFQGLNYQLFETGAPILEGVVAWLDCRIYEMHEGGDHTIFIGEVINTGTNEGKTPLIYGNRQWGKFLPMETSKRSLTHIVMFRLKENTKEDFVVIRDALHSLPAKISQIKHLEVGRNIVESERAYDVALTVVFESLADMEIYQTHPEHVRVVNEVIKPRITGSVAADYES